MQDLLKQGRLKKTETSDLYDFAEKRGIEIINIDLPQIQSVSAMSQSGKCYIGMDPLQMQTQSKEKVHLAHEIGHCEKGAFYNPYSKLDIRAKHEYSANKWAVKRLVPKTDLVSLLKKGYEKWELAEYFDVTEDFINLAIRMYFEYGISV